MTTPWQLNGSYFETCTCKGACPCLYTDDPTEGDCSALVGWHIDRGHYGDTRLDGLNVAMALRAPGNMTAGNWQALAYVDADSDSAQADALLAVFGGQAGGHPAVLASFVGEMLGVERAPMKFEIDDRRRSLRVGNTAEASVVAIEGQAGGEARISGHPFAVAPDQDLVVAKSERSRHQGHGLDWELSGRVGYYSPFAYQSD